MDAAWFTTAVVGLTMPTSVNDTLVIPIPCQHLDFSAHKREDLGVIPPYLQLLDH